MYLISYSFIIKFPWISNIYAIKALLLYKKTTLIKIYYFTRDKSVIYFLLNIILNVKFTLVCKCLPPVCKCLPLSNIVCYSQGNNFHWVLCCINNYNLLLSVCLRWYMSIMASFMNQHVVIMMVIINIYLILFTPLAI